MRDLSKLDECINGGLLRKMPPSRETALRIMNKVDTLLKEAKSSLNADAPNGTLLTAYDTMLLSAKALLIKDGFRERSHYCVIVYIQETYVQKNKIAKKTIELFDHYRTLRHMVAYDIDFMISRADAEESIKDAEFIVKELRKLI